MQPKKYRPHLYRKSRPLNNEEQPRARHYLERPPWVYRLYLKYKEHKAGQLHRRQQEKLAR